jgi:hypothetical protein
MPQRWPVKTSFATFLGPKNWPIGTRFPELTLPEAFLNHPTHMSRCSKALQQITGLGEAVA